MTITQIDFCVSSVYSSITFIQKAKMKAINSTMQQEATMKEKSTRVKKKFSVPHVFVILVGLVIFAVLLTERIVF